MTRAHPHPNWYFSRTLYQFHQFFSEAFLPFLDFPLFCIFCILKHTYRNWNQWAIAPEWSINQWYWSINQCTAWWCHHGKSNLYTEGPV
jgi:hypothetical protein